jgi:hypothetical protein
MKPSAVLVVEPIKPYQNKILSIFKGVNIGTDQKLRCPFCNWVLAEGLYPDKEMTFHCKKCESESTFQRIPV